jgi:hypothetical protein
MPVASATHAPSHRPSSSMAGCQHSGGIRSGRARPRGTRMRTPRRACGRRRRTGRSPRGIGAGQRPRAGRVTGPRPGVPWQRLQGHVQHFKWSVAVLDPALPGRSSPASPSPPAISGRSKTLPTGGAEGLLPGSGRVLFLAECDADRGVEIDPQLRAGLRGRPSLPRPPVASGPRRLDIYTRTRNALLRSARCLGERGFAFLTQRWRTLQHVTASPGKIGQIARAALVLVLFEHKMIT